MNYGDTVVILHPGESTVDPDYGTEVYGEPTEETVHDVAVAPRFTEENNRGQATVAVGLTLLLPEGTVVEPDARVVVRDVTYQVVGEPFDWVNPFTNWRPGVQVDLERAQ